MQIKSFDGLVRLTDTAIIMEFGPSALPEKRAASPRVIPYNHILEIDYKAPNLLLGGRLRIITREGQARVAEVIDTYTAQLTRMRESNTFVEQLRRHVGNVEYQTPPEDTEAPQVNRLPTRAELLAVLRQGLPSASFNRYAVVGDELKKGYFKTWPLGGCKATVEIGAAVSARVTVTRVLAGALMLGPAGALLGAIARKPRSKIYLAITVPGDVILEEVKGPDEGKARRFAHKLNQAAAARREQPSGQATTAPRLPQSRPRWYPQSDAQRYRHGPAWTDRGFPLPPVRRPDGG